MQTICRLLVPIAALAVSACSVLDITDDLSMKQDLGPKVAELQSMRTDLQSQWDELSASLDATEGELTEIATADVSFDSVDTEVYEYLVNDSDVATQVAVQASADPAVRAAAVEAVQQKVASLDAATRTQLASLGQERKRISDRLMNDLPGRVTAMTKSVAAIAAKGAAIDAKAEQLLSVGENNMLMTDADKQKLRTDRSTISAEVEKLTALGNRIVAESGDLGTRIQSATSKLNSMGR